MITTEATERAASVATEKSSRPPSAAPRHLSKLAYIQTITQPTEVGIEEVKQIEILPSHTPTHTPNNTIRPQNTTYRT